MEGDAIGREEVASEDDVTEATRRNVFCFLLLPLDDLLVESTRKSETGSSSLGRLTLKRTPSWVFGGCIVNEDGSFW